MTTSFTFSMTCLLARAFDQKLEAFVVLGSNLVFNSLFFKIFSFVGVFLHFKVSGFSSSKVCVDYQH